MPKRVPVQSIVVFRPLGYPDHAKDEKQMASYMPPLGKPFEMTKDEIDELTKRNPACLSTDMTIDLTTEEGRQLAAAAAATVVPATKIETGEVTKTTAGVTKAAGKASTDDV